MMQKRLLAVMVTLVFVFSWFLLLTLNAQSEESPDLKFQKVNWGPVPMKLVRDEISFYINGEVFNGGGKISRRNNRFSLYFQIGEERILYTKTETIRIDHNNPKGAPKSFGFSIEIPFNLISSRIGLLRKGESMVKVPFHLLIDKAGVIAESNKDNNTYGPFEATIDFKQISKIKKTSGDKEDEDVEDDEEEG